MKDIYEKSTYNMVKEAYMTKHAFGLPEGTVRAILAIILTAGTTYACVITGKLEALVGLAGVAITFYFNKDKVSKPEPLPKDINSNE